MFYIYIAKNRQNAEPTKIGHDMKQQKSSFCVYFRTRIPYLSDATSLPVGAPWFLSNQNIGWQHHVPKQSLEKLNDTWQSMMKKNFRLHCTWGCWMPKFGGHLWTWRSMKSCRVRTGWDFGAKLRLV